VELAELDIKPIELVVVNLYPFKDTIANEDITAATATEFIDIGGPTMVRAAAKNFAHVTILTSPDQYNSFTAKQLNVSLPLAHSLRYGENPHQKAAVYGNQNDFIHCFHGKQLSYNNYLDVDAALSIIAAFDKSLPTCAIIKHTIPCGV
jgi:phosphoribosylaminoimidazolecarboxamide formyltransferase/IMP cyclohydrolase